MKETCGHVKDIKKAEPVTPEGCTDCLKTGDEWVSLRLCLTCGNVGCCDSSKNKHATKHFKHTKHPIVEGYKTENKFRWCYVDKKIV